MHVPNDIVVAGYSKFPRNTSAEQIRSVLAIVVRVDRTTHVIKAVSTTLVTDVADKYISDLLLGANLVEEGEDFLHLVETAYFGHAQRGIISAFRDLLKRYGTVMREAAVVASAEPVSASGGVTP
jgi:Domain of unknown function (DUF3870)